jgi:hypothetical protein
MNLIDTCLSDLRKKLDEGIARQRTRAFGFSEWFNAGIYGDVYIRYGTRYMLIDGVKDRVRCLDLASVNVYHQGMGIGGKILKTFEDAASAESIVLYVENVLNDLLVGMLERRSFIQHRINGSPDWPESYYKDFRTIQS